MPDQAVATLYRETVRQQEYQDQPISSNGTSDQPAKKQGIGNALRSLFRLVAFVGEANRAPVGQFERVKREHFEREQDCYIVQLPDETKEHFVIGTDDAAAFQKAVNWLLSKGFSGDKKSISMFANNKSERVLFYR